MPRRNHPAARRNARRFAGQPLNVIALPLTEDRRILETQCAVDLGLNPAALSWEDQMRVAVVADEVERIEAS